MEKSKYEIQFLPSVAQDIEAIEPQADRRRILRKVDSLAEHPRPHGAEKLAGFDNHYRLRQGNYRIIYRIHDRQLIVVVVRVGHRREVYR